MKDLQRIFAIVHVWLLCNYMDHAKKFAADFELAVQPQLHKLAVLSDFLSELLKTDLEKNPDLDVATNSSAQTLHVMNNGRFGMACLEHGEFGLVSAALGKAVDRLGEEGFERQLDLKEKPSDLLREVKAELDHRIAAQTVLLGGP